MWLYHKERGEMQCREANPEVLIDHAWGWEPCTIADVKAYKPENKSVVSGQVLQYPYEFKKARLVVREMADMLSLDLVDKGLMTAQIVLTVGYDIENPSDPQRSKHYKGQTTTDRYGRKTPKHAHGTENLGKYSSSTSELIKSTLFWAHMNRIEMSEFWTMLDDTKKESHKEKIGICHSLRPHSNEYAVLFVAGRVIPMDILLPVVRKKAADVKRVLEVSIYLVGTEQFAIDFAYWNDDWKEKKKKSAEDTNATTVPTDFLLFCVFGMFPNSPIVKYPLHFRSRAFVDEILAEIQY